MTLRGKSKAFPCKWPDKRLAELEQGVLSPGPSTGSAVASFARRDATLPPRHVHACLLFQSRYRRGRTKHPSGKGAPTKRSPCSPDSTLGWPDAGNRRGDGCMFRDALRPRIRGLVNIGSGGGGGAARCRQHGSWGLSRSHRYDSKQHVMTYLLFHW